MPIVPNTSELVLLPPPCEIRYHDSGSYTLRDGQHILITDPAAQPVAEYLQRALSDTGILWSILTEPQPLDDDPARGIDLSIDAGLAAGSYQLEIGTTYSWIAGADLVSLFYGVCTFIQIVQQAGNELSTLNIDDKPSFARRGVMLDISRDKVPTLDTLKALVDLFASWKLNELQLYTEHTFAYQKHENVWKDASPLTAAEIRELDAYCRARFIDLVPNQNSFGHFHRWLMHPEYLDLAEVPEGLDWPIFLKPRPFSLNAADPRVFTLLDELYAELLPNFSSKYFNVGADETFDLGKGRSAALVERDGRGRVYVDYLKKLSELVHKNGRVMQFWGDIIMEHPELVSELPKDAIALEWGYEADHAFDRDGALFAQAGIAFYVCPGTSSWISLVGRTDNAIGNLRNAAENGIKHGAVGYLNTDWGDFGHLQALPVSYLGFALGAALSWNAQTPREFDEAGLIRALNLFAFKDATGVMGDLAYNFGLVYRTLDDQKHHNGAVMVRALLFPLAQIPEQKWLTSPINAQKVRAAMDHMQTLAARLDEAHPADPLIIREYKLAVALWLHGAKRLLMVVDSAAYTKAAMLAELEPLRTEYEAVWLARNRRGGLRDSLVRLDRLIQEYQA